MQYKIEGQWAQGAVLDLSAGEICWARKDSLLSLTPGLDWSMRVPGGWGEGVRRRLSGEETHLSYIQARRDHEQVILSPNQPGEIISWDLADGPVLMPRGAFIAAIGTNINISVETAPQFERALLGQPRLFLQKIEGKGVALITGAGDFITRQLGEAESIWVRVDSLAAFAATIQYEIQSMAAGSRRLFFGRHGIYMTKLTGPGRVILQTLRLNG